MCFAAAPLLAGPTLTGAPLVGAGFGATLGLPSASALLTTATLIGTGVSTISQIRASNQAAAKSRFDSRIANNNAQIAANNAELALRKGEADIREKKRETGQRIGLQTAQLAAQGFDVSEGSALDILGDTAALGELDVLRIDADAKNRADNFRSQAGDFAAEASFGRFAAKSKKTAGKIKAAGTLITGASRAGTSFLQRKP